MTRADAEERAARHADRLLMRVQTIVLLDWNERGEPYRQAWRADVAEVLDASGYPAALAAAAELLRAQEHELYVGAGGKQWCRSALCDEWPCPAATWLAENDNRTEGT